MKKKSELSEIQKIDGYYNYDHLIQPLATQLTYFIPDYDACLTIAKYYLQLRPYDSVKNDREFYMSRIWEQKPHNYHIGTLGALKRRLDLWNPDYIEWRESAKTQVSTYHNRNTWKNIRKAALQPRISPNILRYLASSRGIREVSKRGSRNRTHIRIREMAISWGIKNIDKETITLKEKLDDLKYIPYENLINITRLHPFTQ